MMAAPRLDASAPAAQAAPSAGPRFRRTCTECGEAYAAAARHGDFCGPACRKAWNNRRLTRGAELYDLVMACRYDRKAARLAKAWTLLCAMARIFREEDHDARDGRPSWRPPAKVLARHPYLKSKTVQRGNR